MRGVMAIVSGLCLVSWASIGEPLRFEAAKASIRPYFSGGALTSDGQLAEYVRIHDAGSYTVTVRAQGEAKGGEWPVMTLQVNDLPRARATVDAGESRAYRFETELTAGAHSIGVGLWNPDWGVFSSRTLRVGVIEIAPPEGARAPVLADARTWESDAQAREAATLARSAEQIAKHRMGPGRVLVTDASGAAVAGAAVHVEQIEHAFLFGCNIAGYEQYERADHNRNYLDRFSALFNYATLPFYWRLLEPRRGHPDFSRIDAMVAWCQRNDIHMKAHPLLWDREAGEPEWASGQPPESARRAHVENTMRRFEGKIAYWEVVNEPANCPGLTIDEPHRWARAVDPDAVLVVNEYGIFYEGHPDFFRLLETAIKNDVPYDVIGIQAHAPTEMAFPLDRVWDILDWYAQLGKKIHITEFTPPGDGSRLTGATWRGRWSEATQAAYSEDFYRVCFAHPAVEAISWWDFSDRGAWVDGGGMLRADTSPKPVYEGLLALVRDEWKTDESLHTDAEGQAAFRGYHGRYRVTARMDGRETSEEADLKPGESLDITLRLPPPD